MQDSLFSEPEDEPPAAASRSRTRSPNVQAASADPSLIELARELPANLRLGTSSWNFPGWIGTVWDTQYTDAKLSRHGLAAYAQHPLFRTVSLDRGFYRPLTVPQFAACAAQVPEDFRFVVKAPSLVTARCCATSPGAAKNPTPCFSTPAWRCAAVSNRRWKASAASSARWGSRSARCPVPCWRRFAS